MEEIPFGTRYIILCQIPYESIMSICLKMTNSKFLYIWVDYSNEKGSSLVKDIKNLPVQELLTIILFYHLVKERKAAPTALFQTYGMRNRNDLLIRVLTHELNPADGGVKLDDGLSKSPMNRNRTFVRLPYSLHPSNFTHIWFYDVLHNRTKHETM